MNRYLLISRLRWPALLLLTGIIALLDQARILSWGKAWPLYLILLGVLALAERATLASQPPPAGFQPGYPYAAGYPSAQSAGGWTEGYPNPGSYAGQSGVSPEHAASATSPFAGHAPAPSTSIVPASSDLELHRADFRSADEEER